jgi:2-oxoglutarate ferredoxin oxidoreductase subunit gamma
MEKNRFLLSGSGGQGVITMGILLAETAVIQEGQHAIQSQSYGPEARGGATRCDVIVADAEIYFPKVLQPNVLVCLTQEAQHRYLQYLRPGGLLLTDSILVRTDKRVDAEHIALPMHEAVLRELGRPQAFNICVLGALLALTGVVRDSSVEKTLAGRFAAAHHANNKKALHLGIDLVKTHGQV